ncbi:hypothetical protein TDB9533_04637 [Thalassocella blandensis]|nr:hypothetical protein TDB9533_04637 [Thalassocella blandensis]
MNKKSVLITAVVIGMSGVSLAFLYQDKIQLPQTHQTSMTASVTDPSLPQSPMGANTSLQNLASGKTADKKSVAEDEDVFAVRDDNPGYDTFYDRYQDIVARRAGLEYDPDALYQAMQQPSAWEEVSEVPAGLNLTDEELNDGRSFINFSELKLESLAEGDTLKISIGQDDIDFEAKISQVSSEGQGESVTWYGESNTPGSTDTITLTQADGLTVGGIFTEQGLYQLEVRNGKGFIVSNATLFRHGEDQQVYVPPEYIENPPEEYVKLEAETFGVNPTHNH